MGELSALPDPIGGFLFLGPFRGGGGEGKEGEGR